MDVFHHKMGLICGNFKWIEKPRQGDLVFQKHLSLGNDYGDKFQVKTFMKKTERIGKVEKFSVGFDIDSRRKSVV